MQTNVPKFRCEQKDICVWFEWVNSLWRMWNNRWGPILLYWRLIIIHVYTHWQPHCSTLNTTPEEFRAAFRYRELSTLMCCCCDGVFSEGWEFSPTDVDRRRCHGLISDQLYIFLFPLYRAALSCVVVHSWYHSQAADDGSWLITTALSAFPQLCVTFPLILHIFALLISALANFICHLRHPHFARFFTSTSANCFLLLFA